MTEDRQKKILKIIMAVVFLVSMYLVAREGAAYVYSDKMIIGEKEDEKEDKKEDGKQKYCVVIDAGHGGC